MSHHLCSKLTSAPRQELHASPQCLQSNWLGWLSLLWLTEGALHNWFACVPWKRSKNKSLKAPEQGTELTTLLVRHGKFMARWENRCRLPRAADDVVNNWRWEHLILNDVSLSSCTLRNYRYITLVVNDSIFSINSSKWLKVGLLTFSWLSCTCTRDSEPLHLVQSPTLLTTNMKYFFP